MQRLTLPFRQWLLHKLLPGRRIRLFELVIGLLLALVEFPLVWRLQKRFPVPAGLVVEPLFPRLPSFPPRALRPAFQPREGALPTFFGRLLHWLSGQRFRPIFPIEPPLHKRLCLRKLSGLFC